MITLLYAAILGLLLVVLSARVILLRRTYRVGVGTGEKRDLERAIRVHGNLTEYAPFALILILLLEMQGSPPGLIHLLGAALVVARLLHAFGLSKHAGPSVGRLAGMTLTFLVILTAAGIGLARYLSSTAAM